MSTREPPPLSARASRDRAYWARRLHGAPRPEEPIVDGYTDTGTLALPQSRDFARLARAGGGAAAVVLAGLAVYGHRLGGARELVVGYCETDTDVVPVRARVAAYASFESVVRRVGADVRQMRRHRYSAEIDDPWPDRSSRCWGLYAETADELWRVQVPGPYDEFVRLFDQLVCGPSLPVGQWAFAADVELPRTSAGSASIGKISALAGFEEQVRRTPAAVAVRSENEALTYAELDARANQGADRLARAGAGPETVVALAVPRSIEAIIALYAVLKTGAAFLPVDPDLPAHRTTDMLETAQPIPLPWPCEGAERESGQPVRVLRAEHAAELVCENPAGTRSAPDRGPVARLHDDQLAYLMFTSGSSGRPKGVAVSHAALDNQLAWMQDRFRLDGSDVVLQKTAVTFDVSLWEVLWPLHVGAQLVVAPQEADRNPSEIARLVERFGVTTLQFVPSTLRLFLDNESLSSGVRRVLVIGEALPPQLANRVPVPTHNLYGPTETCVAVTAHRVDAAETAAVPIGVPAWNTGCYVLDGALHPVPVGRAGELYLTGVQLARGYHASHALTADRFVASPFGSGERMYRTGDIARSNARGELEFLGRNDFQVKIHGLRIELGEIEAALRFDDAVSDALVTVDTANHLHSYVVLCDEYPFEHSALVDAVAARLPNYPLLHTITVLDAFPLTPAGKVDRRALPIPEPVPTRFRAPSGEIAETLAAVFADVLGREEVGMDDSFFGLGGDSIMSILLVSRAEAQGVAITAQQVFEHRTVAALATAAANAGSPTAERLVELPGGGVGEMPLPPTTARLVARGGDFSRFAQHIVLELPIGITRAEVVATVRAVLDRHDMLRSRLYSDAGGRWRLFADPPEAVDADALVRRVETDGVSGVDAVDIAAAELAAAREELEPATGAVVRCLWLDPVAATGASETEPVSGRLVVLVNHIAVDGVSWRILVPDFMSAGLQVAAGRSPQLPEVTTSMRRWAHALMVESGRPGRVAEAEYWRLIAAADDPPIAGRHLDPGADRMSAMAATDFELDPRNTEAVISAVPQRYHATANDILQAALVLTVAGWRPRDTVVLRVESHGREPALAPGADVSRTVGWFTSLYPILFRLDDIDIVAALAGGPMLAAAIKAVKEQVAAVPDRGAGYGLLRYLNPVLPAIEPGEIAFSYLGSLTTVAGDLVGNAWHPARDFDALPSGADPDMPASAVLDITTAVVDERLRVHIGYLTTVLDAAAAAEFAGRFAAVLHTIADHSRHAVGGHTPSDFPLVSSVQADIERWEQTFGGLDDVWPLAPMHAGLLFYADYAKGVVDPYIMQVVVGLDGALDADRLRAAAQNVVTAHPALRTAFGTDSAGVAVALVRPAVSLPWHEVEADDMAGVEQARVVDRDTPFDLGRGPLIRFTLCLIRTGGMKLVVTSHHLACDGWSVPILMRQLLTAYANPAAASTVSPPPSYRTYLAWLARQDRSAAEQAWRAALADAEPSHLVSAPSEPGATFPEQHTLLLGESETDRIIDTAAAIGVTVNTVLQCALAVVLSRHTGRDDVLFGATVSGRPPELPGVETMVGLFINTVPVRVRLGFAERICTVLTRLQDEQAALVGHHHVELAEIQKWAGTRGLALFDTLLVFESYPVADDLPPGQTVAGLSVSGLESYEATHYPLTLVVRPGASGRAGAGEPLRITASWQPAALDPENVGGLLESLVGVLNAIASHPELPIGYIPVADLPLRAAGAKKFTGSEQTTGTVPPQVTDGTGLAEILAQPVEDVPDAVAVAAADCSISYRDMDQRSSRLARALIARGAGPGKAVTVRLDRSPDAVAAHWAVVKTGAAVTDTLSGEYFIDPALAGDPGLSTQPATPVTYLERNATFHGSAPAAGGVRYDTFTAAVDRVMKLADVSHRSCIYQLAPPGTALALLEVAVAAAGAATLVVPAAHSDDAIAALVIETPGDSARARLMVVTVTGTLEVAAQPPGSPVADHCLQHLIAAGVLPATSQTDS